MQERRPRLAPAVRRLGLTAPEVARAGGLRITAAVAAVVVVLDQLTKWWALEALDDRTIDVVWTLRFNLAFNRGMAFSQGQGMGPLIALVAVVVVVVLLRATRGTTSLLARGATGMVAGGALGNLIDRAFRSGDDGLLGGAVVDFIDVQWWPVFNIADIGVVVGALLLVLGGLRSPAPEPAERA